MGEARQSGAAAETPQHGDVRIGISGWTYVPWRKVFYPPDLPQKRELEYASRMFASIEINGTFYSMQTPKSFGKWKAETPDDFVFSVKCPRFITHMKKLREVQSALANFYASGVLKLGEKLGPCLWQMPPVFKFDPELLAKFFRSLPRTHRQASAMAEDHDPWMAKRCEYTVDCDAPMRHAMEIRNDTFRNAEFIALLREYDVALVVADTVEWPRMMDVTANFMYCRLHGNQVLYASGYDDVELDVWAERIRAWASGEEPGSTERMLETEAPGELRHPRDVFVYFDNDIKVRAPYDARGLEEKLRALLPASRRGAELPELQPPTPVPGPRIAGRKTPRKTRSQPVKAGA